MKQHDPLKRIWFEKNKEVGVTEINIVQHADRDYRMWILRPGKQAEMYGMATRYDKANERLIQLASEMVHDGYYIVKQWEERTDGYLRPEVLDALREYFPIGCEVEIVASEVPKCVGVKGKLLEITNSGAFVINQKHTQFSWDKNTFRKISN